MGISRSSKRQFIVLLKQAEADVSTQGLGHQYGISEQTFYRWRKESGGLGTGELKQLKQHQEESHSLKGLIADLTLDKQILHEVLGKTPENRKAASVHRLDPGRVSSLGTQRLCVATEPSIELLPEPRGRQTSASHAVEGAVSLQASLW